MPPLSASRDGLEEWSWPTLAGVAQRARLTARRATPSVSPVALDADDHLAYAKELGARLRAIRTQQGLSLHGVEQRSSGKWKAVVVGSYERGDRAVTVQRLAELAEFYGVPVSELLPAGAPERAPANESPRLVIDLERLRAVPRDQAGPIARLAAAIQRQRGDYNGRVLSIRADDMRSLAVMYDEEPDRLADSLTALGVLTS